MSTDSLARQPTANTASHSKRRCRARQHAFLAAFRVTARISRAAEAVRIGRRRHYHWLAEDPEYRKAFAQASLELYDELMDEVIRRGRDGWLEPVLYRGRVCGYRRRYSDRLLMAALQIRLPEKYR